MSHLKKNIPYMTNPELIGLAKNRFLDEEDQVGIAKWHYKRAHNYLIENINLKESARDILWDYKGYVKKCELIAYGHYLNDQSRYHELYDQYADTIRSRSPWRMSRVFLAHQRWYSHGYCTRSESTGTPGSIIEDIYKKDVLPMHRTQDHRSGYYYPSASYLEQAIIENPNTPTDLIVKISASSPNEQIRFKAMQKMASRTASNCG